MASSSQADIIFLKHESSILRQSYLVAYLDHSSNPVCGFGSATPVLHGTNCTEPNLFHHVETTYRADLNMLLWCFREKMSDLGPTMLICSVTDKKPSLPLRHLR